MKLIPTADHPSINFGRPRSVQSFRQMRGLDLLTACQIRERSREFQASRVVAGPR